MKGKFRWFLLIWVFTAVPAIAQQFGVRVDMGIVQSDEIREASGLAASRKNPGVLWTHNDSGNRNRVFALDTLGRHLGTYWLSGVSNRDWEDIAVGPGPVEGEEYLYIAEIGDNSLRYDVKYIYRVREPRVRVGQTPVDTVLSGVERLPFRYPDGRHNAETLMVDPLTQDIFVVSKGGDTKVYRKASPAVFYPAPTLQVDTLVLVGKLPFRTAVGGDISPDGKGILIKNKIAIYYWQRGENQTVAQALKATPKVVPYVKEPQGEAVTWAFDLSGYYTVSEGLHPHLYFYPWLTTVVRSGQKHSPNNFTLKQNFPNPFNPATTIDFRLAVTARVELAVFALSGQRVRVLVHGVQTAGFHTVRWNGRNEAGRMVPSGVYLYRLRAGGQTKIGKMTLLR